MGFGTSFAQGFSQTFDGSALTRRFEGARAEFKDRQLKADAKTVAETLSKKIGELESHEKLAQQTYQEAIKSGNATADQKVVLLMEVEAATKAKLFGAMTSFNEAAANNPGNSYIGEMAQRGVEAVGQQLKMELQGWQQGHKRLGAEASQVSAQDFRAQEGQVERGFEEAESEKDRQLKRDLQGNAIAADDRQSQGRALQDRGAITANQFADQFALSAQWADEEADKRLLDDNYRNNLKAENPGVSDTQLKESLARELTAQRLVDQRLIKDVSELFGSDDSPEAQEARDAFMEQEPGSLDRHPGEGVFDYLARTDYAGVGQAMGKEASEQDEARRKDVSGTMAGWKAYFKGDGKLPVVLTALNEARERKRR